MFWKGEQLAEALNINGQLYSNLFAHSLSDLHSYRSNGRFTKVNCYGTFFDLISGKGNKPVVFHNFARKLGEKFLSAKSSKALYDAVKSISLNEKIFVNDILSRVRDSEFVSGGVRAEFRIRLCDFYSLSLALDSFFTEEKFKEMTFVFESSLIVNLSCFYVEMLHKQISNNFLYILSSIENVSFAENVVMERITSISLLESLLTTTLFTGLTYNYVGSLTWNRSIVENQSLQLMNHIRELDRPVFDYEFLLYNITIIGFDKFLNSF